MARIANVLGALALAVAAPALAAFGDRDCSFGTNGVQTVTDAFGPLIGGVSEPGGTLLLRMGFTSTSTTIFRGNAAGTSASSVGGVGNIGVADPSIVLLADGKFLVVTGCGLSNCQGGTPFGSPPGVARFLASGGLDTTFGAGGYATLPGLWMALGGPIVQADGRIVVAGSVNGAAALVRFNADGTVDNTFGTNGVVAHPEAANGYGSLAAQSDGKLIVLTQSRVYRHLADGTLDNTFGTAGSTVMPSPILASMVRVQPSDKIVVSGVNGASELLVALFSAAGVHDTTVGNNAGYRRVAIPAGNLTVSGSPHFALNLMPDGRPVVVGGAIGGGGIVRYGLNLEDDATVVVDYAPSAAFAQADGRLVVGRSGSSVREVRRYLGDADAPTCIATTTTLSSSPNPSMFGQGVTLTATVTPASAPPAPGSVQFRRGITNLGAPVTLVNGVATLSVSDLPEGTSSLTAVYAGSGTYLSGTSASHSHVVTPRLATTTTLMSAPNPSSSGQTVTLTATVAPQSGSGTPVGTVQFRDGSTFLGSPVALNGTTATMTTSSLGSGTHSLTAVYSGDATHAPSTSTAVSHGVLGRLSVNDPSSNAFAGPTTMNFQVTLNFAATTPVTVNYATSDITAQAGVHYTATSGTLTFDAGVNQTRIIQVPVAQGTSGSARQFYVTLGSPTNATLGKGSGVGTINYLDPSTLAVYAGDHSVAEGPSGTTLLGFNVSLSRASPTSVQVAYTTADGTALAGADYVAQSGTLTFAPNVTQRWVMVPVNGNTAVDANRTFFLNLSNPSGVTIGKSQGTGTIVDDDPTPAAASIPQYRLYSDETKEHLYTTDLNEYTVLGGAGWVQEGIAYTMFSNAGTYNGQVAIPLYRMYHAGIRQHHWTTDSNEVMVLAAGGAWAYEGIPGYLLATAATGSTPLYRLMYHTPPLHLWTTDLNEKNVLSTQYGWVYEGVVGEVLP